ncbi:hypothetical protein LWI28_017608 [Acer negundo]|uniref:Transmembrane protein n=1 Tax=Acer negundo TaxID=4023 RepID=A0AAD5J082_ACENE|nr:hypothetical protein LWI28_017608 [Acer negundo]
MFSSNVFLTSFQSQEREKKQRVARCSFGGRCCFPVPLLLCSPFSAVAAAALGYELLLVSRWRWLMVTRFQSMTLCCSSASAFRLRSSFGLSVAVVPRGLLVGSTAAVIVWDQCAAWFSGWISCGCLLLVPRGLWLNQLRQFLKCTSLFIESAATILSSSSG